MVISIVRNVAVGWLAMCLGWTGLAQEHPQSAAAGDLFKREKWAEAAETYTSIVADEPRNAQAWRQLGMSRYQLKEFDAAVEALKKVIELSPEPNTMYNIACAYALSDQPTEALDWIEKAAANNLSPFAFPEKDPDLKVLYDLPRFKNLVTGLDKKRRPCQYSAEARQFDFWLGTWDVFNPQGQQAGTSEIVSVSEGCGILEQWKNRGGTTGTSLNFYDAATKKWYQYWMGPTGIATRYEGEYRDGAMRYLSERSSGGGTKILLRLTFFDIDANTVRQFAEQSADDGKTWTVSYDFKYVRKKQ